jgi:hypothetical protein
MGCEEMHLFETLLLILCHIAPEPISMSHSYLSYFFVTSLQLQYLSHSYLYYLFVTITYISLPIFLSHSNFIYCLSQSYLSYVFVIFFVPLSHSWFYYCSSQSYLSYLFVTFLLILFLCHILILFLTHSVTFPILCHILTFLISLSHSYLSNYLSLS